MATVNKGKVVYECRTFLSRWTECVFVLS